MIYSFLNKHIIPSAYFFDTAVNVNNSFLYVKIKFNFLFIFSYKLILNCEILHCLSMQHENKYLQAVLCLVFPILNRLNEDATHNFRLFQRHRSPSHSRDRQIHSKNYQF